MRLKVTILAWLLIGCTTLLTSSLQAQYTNNYNRSATGNNALWLDHAIFSATDDPQLVRLEVYYKIYNFGLSFEEEAGKFRASYEVHISIDDRDDIPVQSFNSEKDVVVAEVARTRSLSDFRSSQAIFELPPGKYKINFLLQDGVSESTFRHDFKVNLKLPNDRKSQLSDIMFVLHSEPANDRQSIFRKGDMIVIPSVSKDYGGEDDSQLAFYIEAYLSGNDKERLVFESLISSVGGKKYYRDTTALELDAAKLTQLKSIPIDNLSPGEYNLEVTLRGRRNKKLSQKRESFTIIWSQSTMLKNNYKESLRQLELVAYPGEIKEMKKIELFEDRLRAFNQFWEEKDPTPETPVNEAKIEFYRRVSYANYRFRFLRQAGWSTDRGRTYVRFGEPDAIDDVPMSPGSAPYQIWHYYQGSRYLKFVFIDDDFDGDYRLQWPYDGRGHRPDF